MATIIGTLFDDLLMGTESSGVIVAKAGNDTIQARGGNDTIRPGVGNDVIDGGLGKDTGSYAGLTAAVAVLLAQTTEHNTGRGDILVGVHDDRLRVRVQSARCHVGRWRSARSAASRNRTSGLLPVSDRRNQATSESA